MFVETEENLTIYVSQKLREQKPEISHLEDAHFYQFREHFFHLVQFSGLTVTSLPSSAAFFKLSSPFPLLLKSVLMIFAFSWKKTKTIFPDRRKKGIPFSMI